MSTRSCTDEAAANNGKDDDDIGALIYQHAKREAEKEAARRAFSKTTAVTSRRRSARDKRTTKAKAKRSTLHPQRDSWTTRYNELMQYKRDFGNCNVPQLYKTNPQLGTWVNNQRMSFKSKSLADVRVTKLNEIGFAWKIKKEDAWMELYNKLVEFKQINGHCNVPQRYQSNPQLGLWVQRQRRFYKNKKYITQHRIAKLNQIGFDWNFRANIWMKQYSELVKYKSEFGDCNVPHQWKTNTSLANWVHKQREYFKGNTMSKSYIAKLNKIGFTWKFDRKRIG
jgi:hypothetical protein